MYRIHQLRKIHRSSSLPDWLWGVIVVTLPLIVYLHTMAPTVYGLDSAELTTGAYTLGIVHPPGSPTFLLLGYLFTWLPIGDVGYRVNLLSTFAAALVVLNTYILLKVLTDKRIIALGTAWLFAFTYYPWVSALAAELYALQALFTVVTILLAILWRESGNPRYLYGLGLLLGLGLGNHLSIVLLIPGLAWIVLSRSGTWRRAGWLSAAVGCFLLGTAIYLYIPIRYASGTSLNYARQYWGVELNTFEGFFWMISARMFKSLFWAVPTREIPAHIYHFIQQLWSNFLGMGFLLGLIGIFVVFRQRFWLFFGLLLMWVNYLAFYIPYGVGDKEVMFLPVYLIWAIWVGVGANRLDAAIQKPKSNKYRDLLTVGMLVFAGSSLAFNYAYVDLSQDYSARKIGEKIFQSIEPKAMYFGTWYDVPILEYLQWVENQRKDVTTVNLLFISTASAQNLARKHLLAHQPVYTSTIDRFPKSEFTSYRVKQCECYRVEIP